MDKILNLYDRYLELKKLVASSSSYNYNHYLVELFHISSDLNHAMLSARRPAVKELCRLAWQDVEAERKRIRPLCNNGTVTQQ